MDFGLLHSLLQLTSNSLFSALLVAIGAPKRTLVAYWSFFLASLCAGVREPVEHALFVKEGEDLREEKKKS